MIEIIGAELYQWDTGRSVSVKDVGAEKVHFANQGDSRAVIMDVEDSVAKIPDYLFQTGKQLCVYAVENGVTIESKIFSVKKRERPENYVYEEDQRNYIYELIQSAENATAEAGRVAEELRTARENGEFVGPQGPQGEVGPQGPQGPQGEQGEKGDPGVVKFVVVNELPETDTENAIYLVPVTEGAEDNLFDEYIFIDGQWEKIGSAAVAVDLTDYVKNTDYPGVNAGVVRVNAAYGISFSAGNGNIIYIVPAANWQIEQRKSCCPIVPTNLDLAVKVGMTTNTEEWTEEEKQAARDLLGAASTNFATASTAGLVRCGEGLYMASSSGKINLTEPTEAQILARTTAGRAITPSKLDYAVKTSICDNKYQLTAEEKAAAQAWLGITNGDEVAY